MICRAVCGSFYTPSSPLLRSRIHQASRAPRAAPLSVSSSCPTPSRVGLRGSDADEVVQSRASIEALHQQHWRLSTSQAHLGRPAQTCSVPQLPSPCPPANHTPSTFPIPSPRTTKPSRETHPASPSSLTLSHTVSSISQFASVCFSSVALAAPSFLISIDPAARGGRGVPQTAS